MSIPTSHAPIVLVVDDEPIIRDFITSSLAMQGRSVLSAGSALEAIQVLLQSEVQPSLALIELCLPDWQGVTLGQFLRRAHPGLQCGYITWSDAPSDARLLRKPFSHQALNEFVQRLLDDAAEPLLSRYDSPREVQDTLRPHQVWDLAIRAQAS